MAPRTRNFGIGVRNTNISNGGLSIQPIVPTDSGGASTPSMPSVSVPSPSGGSSRSSSEGIRAPSINVGAAGVASGVGAATIGHQGALGAIAASRLNLPIDTVPAVRFIPPSAHLIKEIYPVDSLNVAQTRMINGQFVPITDAGISPFRPEILGIFDFSPIYKLGSKLRNNDIGDFIDIQYQASHLREETLLKVVERIQRNSRRTLSDDAFNRVRERYSKELQKAEENIADLQDIQTNINNIKASLEIKKIPATFYNTTNFLSPEDFFARRMQYKRNQFAVFSDTKILLQLLFDFRAILEGYSTSLLDLRDPDRESDYNPIQIDKTYTQSNGFTFTLGNLRSVTSPINATETNFFNQFLNSLPQDPDDRIRILTTLLGKEYLVSRGLGRQDLQRLLQGFGVSSTGNPFDAIIGEVGDTIFEKPKGQSSIASLMFVDPGVPNASVLPFENKHVDSNDQKFVYVPGSAYFVDTVLSTTGENWNTGPYVNFINLYNSRIKDARTVIEDFLSLKNLSTLLAPGTLSDSCMKSLKASTSTLTEKTSVSGDQATITALLKLATTDADLKAMLFQFSILIGMAVNSETEQREIFDILAKSEITSLRKMSFLEIPEGVEPNPARGQAVIKPYIEQLADAIEKRVILLTTKNLGDYARLLASVDIVSQLRPFRSSWLSPALHSSALSTSLLGNIGLSGGAKKDSSVTVHLQRGNIARILKNITASGGDNKTNLIEEFVGMATSLFKAAQIQGANVHLLQDGTNRTRYNFLSISTQLLMLFEIFSSYASRYAFASFEKTFSKTESVITVDTTGNKVISLVIEELTKKTAFSNLKTLIPTTVSPNLDTLRSALGATGLPGSVSIRGTSLSPQIGLPATSNTQIRRTIGTADGSIGGNRLGFSSSIFTSVSGELRNLLESSVSSGDISSSGLTLSRMVKDIADPIGSLDRVREVIRNSDKYVGYRVSLGSTRGKIYEEFNTIGNCLHILTAVGQYLQKGSEKIQSAFNQTSLQSFLRANGSSGLSLLRNSSQARTAAYILQTIKDKTPAQDYSADTGYVYNNLVVSDTTTLQEYRCLRALLASDPYINSTNASPSANKRIKLLSVGIPAGFATQLADRVNLGEINANSYKDKEFDVVNINVYKRDARFDDIVFKPQRFLFDLSLFALEKDVNNIQPRADESFARILERTQLTDYTNLRNPRKLNLTSIRNDQRYDFLTEDERKNLISSHLSSYLLGLYINFMSGMKVSEDVFLQGGEPRLRNLNAEVQQIVFSYLRDVMRINIPAGQTIAMLLQNRSISEDAKDIIRLFDYGSLVFNEQEVATRVLTPKSFDRIFNIPLNIEGFEIDVEKTLATESGRRTWGQSYLQNKLVQSGGRFWFRPRSKNELIFEDFFVAIETANDREPT